jgi:hypothetical protein
VDGTDELVAGETKELDAIGIVSIDQDRRFHCHPPVRAQSERRFEQPDVTAGQHRGSTSAVRTAFNLLAAK